MKKHWSLLLLMQLFTAWVVAQSFTIVSPNGGENWAAGSAQNITWSSSGIPAGTYVELYYSTDGGVNFTFIDDGILASAGSYSWTVPNVSSTQCQIAMQDASWSYQDYSDSFFTISGGSSSVTVNTPNGGENWCPNTYQYITWTSSNISANVNLAYSTNNGSTWTSIATATSNDGSHYWYVPSVSTTQALVRVSDYSDTTIKDISNATFTIGTGLTVTYPNGGETLTGCNTINVTWNKSCSTSNYYNIDYSTNNGTTWSNIVAYHYASGSTGSYSWSVPSVNTSQALVRVRDSYDTTNIDVSNTVFSITPVSTTITLTSPNGGEIWNGGTTQNITWSTTGTAFSYVNIQYSTDGGSTWTDVATWAYNTGSYTWTVPTITSSNVLIQIRDYYTYCVTDQSNAVFTINTPTSITVTTPNGGESWCPSTYQYIYWSSVNIPSSYVNLAYSTNNGSTWTSIANGTNNDGSYQWYIPSVSTTQALVRVSDYSDSTIKDISDTVFTISNAGISVTSPNGGESYTGCTTQNITWNKGCSTSNYYNIDYSTNNGTTWSSIVTYQYVSGSTGTYSWSVPSVSTTQALVRVRDSYDTTKTDVSNAVFSITPGSSTITLTSPNGGETLNGGTNHNITWTNTGSISYVVIRYSTDGGSSWTTIVNGASNTGTYAWSVPTVNSGSALIDIRDYYNTCVTDISNAVFSINTPPSITVTTPNGGETWCPSTYQYIYWSSVNIPSSYVNLAYSTNNGSTWTSIINGTSNDGSYNWYIPSVSTTQALIRVSDYSDSTIKDVSNAVFTISSASIAVTAPNGGESYSGCTTQNITWNKGCSTSNYFNIDYSTNNGTTWNSITTYQYASGSTGTYSWSVPSITTSQALVRVRDYYDTTKTDVSNAVFSITPGSSTITLTSPNGGEALTSGSTHNITWTTTGTAFSYVTIRYSTNGGSSWTTIVNGASNTGTYAWTVPSVTSSNVLIDIRDYYNTCVTDMSNAVFSINTTPSYITVNTPNGGESWTAGTYNYITWTANNATYVDIHYSTNNGSTWTTVTTGTSNDGSHYWYVPSTPTTTALVRVRDYYDNSIADTSNAVFTIVAGAPSLTVTTPNGGENWMAGSGKYIYWSSANINKIKLEYSANNGTTWSTITDSTNASSGYYYWVVPDTATTTAKVRATDIASATTDMSNSTFTITQPYITVTTPNGGEVWTGNTYQYIYWSSNISSNYVNIQYSLNNGATWNTVVSGAYNYGYYNWYVPNTATDSALVRVSDYYNGTVLDVSNAVFKINAATPTLSLTDPNGGETWYVGTNQTITWNSTSVNYVKIEYTLNGLNWNSITSSTAASSGYYNWTIPNTPTTKAKVRISDVSNPALKDMSDALFTIATPSIVVNSPNGGESWTGLTYNTISWTGAGTSSYVTLEYSTNNGSSWSTIANGIYNTGSYSWLVPNSPTTTARVRVKDYYSSVMDASDTTFTILAAPATIVVNSPNGGENWGVGSSKYITWSSSAVSNVKIEYSTNGGSTWNTITSSTSAASGYFTWTVPNAPTSNALVKITDASNATVTDMSNATFSITSPYITVTTPNGGETWTANTYQNINWNSSGASSYVKIEYSTDNGSSWSTIVNGAYNSGSYNWYIPNSPTNIALIKVSDYYNNAIKDSSNAVFTILKAPGTLTLSSPNGGEKWAVGSKQYIYWNSTGVDSVQLEYSADGGSTWKQIISKTGATSGQYLWTVPNSQSTNVYVKVSNADSLALNDMSNYAFTIALPYITITAPNGGETLYTGNGYYITWNTLGIPKVKIEYSVNNGSTWNSIVGSTINYGYYYWNVPDSVTTTAKIKVTSVSQIPVFKDESDAVFTIATPTASLTLNSPNGGEYWYSGYPYYITWSATAVDNVMLEYSTDNGTNWITITTSTTATSGFYYWNVPNTPSTTSKIRITDVLDNTLTDASNNVFTIAEPVPSLIVNYPNGGETYYEGSYQYISWNNNFVNAVDLAYSVDSGSTWTSIASNLTSNYYYWYVPSNPSTKVYVKVTSTTDTAVTDSSNNVFTIATPVANTNAIATDSISPMTFCKEDTITVYFTASGVFNAGNTFTAQISDSTGSFAYPVAIGSVQATAADSLYAVIPASVLNATGYRIRVVSSDLPSTTVTDNGTDITISSPEFDFVADETIKYLPNSTTNFTYLGDTTNKVSYEWSFGDGATSTDVNPTNTYGEIGYYSVSLKVTDNNGCAITQNKYDYMRIERLFENTKLNTNTTSDITGASFVNSAKGCVSLANGNCLVTADSGATWTESVTGISTALTGASLIPGAWFVTGQNGNISMSSNGGTTWTPFYTGTTETFNSSSFTTTTSGYAVGTNGIIYYYNGTTWTAQASNTTRTLNSVYAVGSNAFAFGENGVIRKYNGTSWVSETSPVTNNLRGSFFSSTSKGYAVGDGGVILTYDGSNWNVSLSGVDIDFSSIRGSGADSAWAVGSSGIIYRTYDGGQVWERYSIGTTNDNTSVEFIGPNGRSTAGNKGYITGKGGDARSFGGSQDEEDTTGTGTGTIVNEIEKPVALSVYPNPATSYFTINAFAEKNERVTIRLKDIEGRDVKVIADENISGTYTHRVETNGLAPGLYFIHAAQGGRSWVQKIVITQ